MEYLPREIISLICISNLKNCRLISRQFNYHLNNIFYEKLSFYYSSDKIKYGYDFIQNIIIIDLDNIKKFSNLKKIYFIDSFNGEIKGAIPNSVTHLTFGHNFNKDIKGAIPNSVTHLTFDKYFNQEITEIIPEYVIYLFINEKYNKKLPNNIGRYTHFIKY